MIRHPNWRPPGNTRFKRPLEISNDSNKIINGIMSVIIIIKDTVKKKDDE